MRMPEAIQAKVLSRVLETASSAAPVVSVWLVVVATTVIVIITTPSAIVSVSVSVVVSSPPTTTTLVTARAVVRTIAVASPTPVGPWISLIPLLTATL
jgi:hypothetical protein